MKLLRKHGLFFMALIVLCYSLVSLAVAPARQQEEQTTTLISEYYVLVPTRLEDSLPQAKEKFLNLIDHHAKTVASPLSLHDHSENRKVLASLNQDEFLSLVMNTELDAPVKHYEKKLENMFLDTAVRPIHQSNQRETNYIVNFVYRFGILSVIACLIACLLLSKTLANSIVYELSEGASVIQRWKMVSLPLILSYGLTACLLIVVFSSLWPIMLVAPAVFYIGVGGLLVISLS